MVEGLSIAELEKQIRIVSMKYYTGQNSGLTDNQFDLLDAELRKRNPDSDVFRLPGYGYVPEDSKIPHIGLFEGSLRKVHAISEVPLEKGKMVITPKLDGLSVILYYKGGILDRAVTRGNGYVGKDCTKHMKKLIPEKIADKRTLFVHGEVVTKVEYEDELKAEGVPSLRNYAAGVINRKESTSDLNKLMYVPYFIRFDSAGILVDKVGMLVLVGQIIGNSIPYKIHSALFHEDLEDLYEEYKKKYTCDGLVITSISINTNDEGLYTEKSVAYKFKGETMEGIVDHIDWGVGFTGKLTPVVVLTSPVLISGANIQNITMHNMSTLVRKGIGPGAIVEVERSGEVIPQIKKVIKSIDSVDLPTKCPICKSEVVADLVELRCINPVCSTKTGGRLDKFLNVIAPIDGLGLAIYNHLCEVLKIKDVPDLLNVIVNYDLDLLMEKVQDGFEDIHGMSSHALKLVEICLKRFHRDCVENTLTTDKFLMALRLQGIGNSNSEKMAPVDLTKSLKEILDHATELHLPSPVFTSLEANYYLIQKCLEYIKVVPRVVTKQEITMKVAITGSLETCKRNDFEKRLKEKGIVIGGVGKNTNYLITNNPSNSSKTIKARELGISIINEEEFIEKYLK